MTKKRKIFLSITAVLLFVLAGFVYLDVRNEIFKIFQHQLYYISVALENYILANGGEFPKNEEAFEAAGLFYKVDHSIGVDFQVRADRRDDEFSLPDWRRCSGRFKIRYGADSDNCQIIEGVLCDKVMGKPVLLVDGPFRKLMRNYEPYSYESVSVSLYKEMLRMKEQAEGN